MTNEIQVIQDNEIAIAFQNFTAKELFERVKEQAMSVVFDLNDPKDQKALKSHVYKIRQSKTAFDAHGKALKDQYTEVTSKIDAERKVFKTSCDQLIEELLQPLVEIELAEKKRIEMLELAVNDIKSYANIDGLNSSEIAQKISSLKAISIGSNYQEKETEAKIAKYETIELLEKLYIERQQFEKEAEEKRIAEEAEKKRLQAEYEEKIKREAVAKAKAEAEQREAHLKAEAEALKKKAIIDAENAEKAKQQAIEAERQRIAEEAEKKKAEEFAKAEAERKSEEKRQANKAHQKRICEKALSDLSNIVLDDQGFTLGSFINNEQLKKVIIAIHKGEISNISINY